MATIRQIDDSELNDLIELFYLYNQCLVSKFSRFKSTQLLIERLSKPGALALGLYIDDKLEGFTTGHEASATVYHFTALYIKPKFRIHMKKLFEASEDSIRPSYKSWISESSTKEGINMHHRMGANDIEIRFHKEL